MALLVLEHCQAAASAALPDARAYEQSSPVDKNGLSALGHPSLFQAADTGDGVVFFTESPLPGTEGASNYAPSLASRSSESWTTQGLLTPSSTGREGRVAGWSEDTRYSYVVAPDPGNGSNFLQKDTQSRAVKVIAHFASEFGLVSVVPIANSSDDSRLLFEAKKQIFPEASEENNVYLWNDKTETVRLVSVVNPGEPPFESSAGGAYGWTGTNALAEQAVNDVLYRPGVLSSDGSEAVFSSGFINSQLYLRRHVEAPQSVMAPDGSCEESEKACTIKLSASQASAPDPNGEKAASFFAASTQGPEAIFFGSSGKLTDNATTGPSDEGFDLYHYDVASGHLVDLTSSGETPSEPNGAEVRGILGISTSGARAYFVANGVLGDAASRGASNGDCSLPTQGPPESGECNLYLWESGVGIRYIARLNAAGSQSGLENPASDGPNWIPGLPQGGSIYGSTARVSEDGNVAIFRSQEQLVGTSTLGAAEYYRYTADNGRLDCITCNPSGGSQNYPPSLSSDTAFMTPNVAATMPRNMSANGKRFFFESAEALVAEDTNGVLGCPLTQLAGSQVPKCQDVYEWEVPGEGTCTTASSAYHSLDAGCLFLISSGESDEPSFFGDADRVGANAFFMTSQGLVAQDRDELIDVYDARIGGGLAGQNQVPPPPCLGGGDCGRTASSPPSQPMPSSLGAPSGQQPRKQLRCGKGMKKSKKHGKQVCVKKKATKKHRKAARGAGHGHEKGQEGASGRGSK